MLRQPSVQSIKSKHIRTVTNRMNYKLPVCITENNLFKNFVDNVVKFCLKCTTYSIIT